MVRAFGKIRKNPKFERSSLPVQSRLAITRLTITRIGYNAVGRGPRISAAREKMGATANNNAVINCHLCL